MQPLKLPTPRPLRRAAPTPVDEATRHRRDVRWGVLGLVTVVVAAVCVGVTSVVRFDITHYSAYVTDAASLRVGDEVRLAGITVGEVTGLDLESDRVRMRFTVADDVFVGAQSSLDIRMLTIVGGHYVALHPGGGEPLSRTPIPADRVGVPYNLTQAFQDAIGPIEGIDGDTLRANFGALTTAIDGSPDAFRRLLGGVGSIVGILDRQNADISETLAVADEYLFALAGNKAALGRLLTSLNLLETIVENNVGSVGAALRNLAVVLGQLQEVTTVWTRDVKPLAQSITDAVPELEALGAALGALLDSVRGLGERVRQLITPEGIAVDQSAAVISAPALCIPFPGRSC